MFQELHRCVSEREQRLRRKEKCGEGLAGQRLHPAGALPGQELRSRVRAEKAGQSAAKLHLTSSLYFLIPAYPT